VLAVFCDVKVPLDNNTDGTVDAYRVCLQNVTDYSPFGVSLDGRTIEGDFYRRGFNGMEKDDEVKGDGNSYDFGARIFDARIGRWLSLDPLMTKYPALTPYGFCSNDPIIFIDFDGKDFVLSTNYTYDGTTTPTNIHQLGNTSLDKTNPLALKYNATTKEFDFTLNVNVQFTSNFTSSGGGSMEKVNPGLYREVKAHEDGHVQQFFEAAKKNIEVTINVGGEPVTYSGRPDQVLTKAYNDFDVKLKAETQAKINYGDFKDQAEVDAYMKTETDKFMTTTFKDLHEMVVNKIGENIQKGMAGNMEDDANNRAAKKLGAETIKYINRKKEIKSNTGSGKTLNY
jgi:RHS repeat-associated protein